MTFLCLFCGGVGADIAVCILEFGLGVVQSVTVGHFNAALAEGHGQGSILLIIGKRGGKLGRNVVVVFFGKFNFFHIACSVIGVGVGFGSLEDLRGVVVVADEFFADSRLQLTLVVVGVDGYDILLAVDMDFIKRQVIAAVSIFAL